MFLFAAAKNGRCAPHSQKGAHCPAKKVRTVRPPRGVVISIISLADLEAPGAPVPYPFLVLNSLVKPLPHRTRGGASLLTDEEWLRSGDSRMRSGAGHYFCQDLKKAPPVVAHEYGAR